MIRKMLVIAATAMVMVQGSAFAQETIKLGLINFDAGPFAVFAPFVKDGATLAVETLNAQGGALGRKYELVTQYHSGAPATAIAAATRLAEQQGVSFIAGLSSSSTSLALSPKLSAMNVLFLDSTAASDDLTGKNCQKNYFRVGLNDTTFINGVRALLKDSGTKSWDLFMGDYALGHDYAKRFTALVQENGGTVQKTLFVSPSVADVGSYISQLLVKPADGLMVLAPGTAGIVLAKQQQPFGLFAKYKSVFSVFSTNETIIAAQGDATAGMLTPQSYFWSMPGARNAAFVKAFEARFNRKPTFVDADTYLSFELLNQAILKAKSTDVAAVRTALAGLKAATIAGDVEMRAADHQLLRSLVITQATKVGDGKGDLTLKSVESMAKISPELNTECKM
ncbi:ABC transporter substrate-binding protein [Glaciimonas sp. CA11.2]|uniref:ABC transporter substrate-binding protein n=1 Tax=Glaciimonas sp. CA11.2 TaxID=3048601 RepID=UPI002AB3557D|nr:ABC transporter substrate-binding protein [Glaciimonas sp. CA11.2]MDY7546132.1 ABC transporter substrate-binding protein [Glaciimonas sp. CA11.2]MEB0161828.1 ABC transporter substrate-binding protein [Glaciimonas sp. CA11.2]